MRTARNRRTTYALGVAAVAALLSTAACSSGGTDEGKGATPSRAPSATGTPSTGGTTTPAPPSGTPSTAGSATPGAATTSASPSKGGGSGKPGTVACNDNDLSITSSVWRQDSGQNMLITATNFTDKPCTLYHYPYVGLGPDIEGPIAPMGPNPRALATIGPKEKAYAGVFLFRGGERTTAFESFSLGYQDRAFNSNRDVASLDIALSTDIDFLNAGLNPRVTYWNRDLGAVEDTLFRSGKN
ncbi:DUF4232 domain-containing protein [Streptomyces sp. P9(2023)]|uniref:DUF4232 domain-containing protein n=1 Tax=Streptomyces sp. P9(2023) TaxID=3064394 RepID=UPI0028F40C3D|nr:DUF4232 domain-containing protein [Streptomyces sp. P9(2023)]MDT9688989.1 DUF4232 domain-containing protein [Streptomyces sp. P9(2023)]